MCVSNNTDGPPSAGERAGASSAPTAGGWAHTKRYSAGMQICAEEFDRANKIQVIVSGWACELRMLHDGRRQVFTFMLPGDIIDFPPPQSSGARSLVALTQVVVASHPLQWALGAGPATVAWLNGDPERREARRYNQAMRLGCMTTRERVVHLLLEFRDRLTRAGLVKGEAFKIPITQEVLADALGLSVVHINRALRELREKGLVVVKSGSATVTDIAACISLSGYQPEEL